MFNWSFQFRHFILLALLGGFLEYASIGGAAESGAGSPAKGLGVDPSEEGQVRESLDFLQAMIDQMNARRATAEPQQMEPEVNPLFGAIESYIQENRNAWYVILLKLTLAAFLGLILALVYRATYTGKRKKYSPSMMQSQLLLAVGGSLIWIVVATSLVRAFGLAGMVGLIRYRTPVRDPKDNVMVFLSMGIGMACGLGQVAVAVVSTGFLTIVLFGLYAFRLGKKKKKKKPKSEKAPPPAPSQD